MIERGGGRAKTMVVPDTKAATLRPVVLGQVDPERATLMSDSHPTHRSMDR